MWVPSTSGDHRVGVARCGVGRVRPALGVSGGGSRAPALGAHGGHTVWRSHTVAVTHSGGHTQWRSHSVWCDALTEKQTDTEGARPLQCLARWP